MSGTQLATSTLGSALIAIPDPLTGGLGYVIMKAGDKVGMVERLWNMSREGRQLTKKNNKPLEIVGQPQPDPKNYQSLQKRARGILSNLK